MSDSLSDADLLKMATGFDVFIDHTSKTVIRVVSRYWNTGGKSWAVSNESNFVLNIDGDWEYEQPTMAARDDDFIARTRWPHPREAVEAALKAVAVLKAAAAAEQKAETEAAEHK
jgi:hypothetical protein